MIDYPTEPNGLGTWWFYGERSLPKYYTYPARRWLEVTIKSLGPDGCAYFPDYWNGYAIKNLKGKWTRTKPETTMSQPIPQTVIDAAKVKGQELMVDTRRRRTAANEAKAAYDTAQGIYEKQLASLSELAEFLDAQPDNQPPALFQTWKKMLVENL